MKKIIYTTVFLLFSLLAMAQNDAQYTHYLFNRLAYNPAYAGSPGMPVINAINRNQWNGGFANGKTPTTSTINFHSPIQCGRAGIGFGFTSDEAGIFTSNRLDGAYAYKFPVSQKGTLSIGLSAQLELGKANFNQTNPLDQGDPLLNGESVLTQNKINFGTGLYYTYDDIFFVGLSVPQLLNTSYFQSTNISGDGNDFHTYYFMVGAVEDISDNVKFMLGTMVSFQGNNAPFELDINANFVFMEKIWVGLNYRKEDSIDGLLQYQLSNNLKAGFAYDFPISAIKNYSTGSVEFLLSYAFNQYSNKISNVRYF